jgi:DNA-binding transcriptional LysR family regulator
MGLRNQRIWQYIDEVARVGSVRQAAERLNVTPSALLRRIQDVEHDLDTTIFERHTSGVRLTAAGELLIGWIRSQNAELRRVYSQIEELEGLQRGEIRIACSQAVSRSFVLRHVAQFRARHPSVKFKVTVTDHATALRALINYEIDLVLIFRPLRSVELQPIMSVGQGLDAIMSADHPLASKSVLRLRECAEYSVAMPDMSFGGREIVESRLMASSTKFNVAVESNSFDFLAELVATSDLITFQIDIGADTWRRDPRFAVHRISDVDRTYGPLVLGQLKGRPLPIVAAKFAEQMALDLSTFQSPPTTPNGQVFTGKEPEEQETDLEHWKSRQ